MITAHRGKIAHCLPTSTHANSHRFEYFTDGLLIIDEGVISNVGPAEDLLKSLSHDVPLTDHGDNLIVPGFIDSHVHYPQTDVIASYGTQLLEWLENYTFPAEMAFADEQHAQVMAEFFFDELLKNGTTSALIFATVHPQSVDAIFRAAQKRNMRVAAGKVLMDRNCPAALQDTAESGYSESRRLLEQWHKQDRLHYAITPRFAITSSHAQLKAAGQLASAYPDSLIHTHLAENKNEIAWVKELFPDARSYLDVYQHHGLVRDQAVFAHCIHLDDHDFTSLANSGGGIAFCPTSNLFLGSGLFDLARAHQHGVHVGLGTDVGGGTSFSLLQTLNEAYKVLQLQQQSLDSASALYLATLGAAKTLGIDHKVGNFETGKEADFVILNATATPLLERRLKQARDLSQAFFMHMILGDDRSVAATYILGECAYRAEGEH